MGGGNGNGGDPDPTKGEISPPTPGGEDPTLSGGGGDGEYGGWDTPTLDFLDPYGETRGGSAGRSTLGAEPPVETGEVDPGSTTLGEGTGSVIPPASPGDTPPGTGGGIGPDVGPDTGGPTGGGPADVPSTTPPAGPGPQPPAPAPPPDDTRRRLRSLLTGYEDPELGQPDIFGRMISPIIY